MSTAGSTIHGRYVTTQRLPNLLVQSFTAYILAGMTPI
jgi:hypothetical protein